MQDRWLPTPSDDERNQLDPPASIIGFRNRGFNKMQYDAHAREYIEDNPLGVRGGKTPAERVAAFSQVLPPGKTVLEIGSGPGHDALALKQAGYNVIASDIADGFINPLRQRGLKTLEFDASTDRIPDGIDGIFTHIALHHITPKDLTALLTRARKGLQDGKGLFLSVVEGRGHERSQRTGRFARDWFYYTPQRLKQILEQEGVNIHQMDRVTASNNTPTLHVTGTFAEEAPGSYGERGLQPFGDVYYDINGVLYDGNLTEDVAQDQVKKGILSPEIKSYMDAARETYERRKISYADYISAVNSAWAVGLRGKRISMIKAQLEEFLDRNASKFPRYLASALAVANNNGFSNILNTNEPNWLIEAVAHRLGADDFFGTEWLTTTGDPKTGTLLGLVEYPFPINKRRMVAEHQKKLKEELGSKYRRIKVGVVNSVRDGFAETTDYPIVYNPHPEDLRVIFNKGYFLDEQGYPIYADDHPWPRWQHFEKGNDLARYINIITSERYPITPYASDYSRRTAGGFPLWMSKVNVLNENYYKIGDNPDIYLM